MAAIAVSLATGGYSLGVSQSFKPDVKEVQGSSLGAEHPVTVALQQPGLQPKEREKLIQVSQEATRKKQKSLLTAQIEAKQLKAVAQQKYAQVALLEAKLHALEQAIHESQSKKGKVAMKEVQRQLTEARTIQQLATAASQQIDTALLRKIDDEAAKEGLASLSQDTQEHIFEIVATRRTLDANKGFALMTALDHREVLALTPAQVTKLQLLQADFIRYFAPLREQYELAGTEEKGLVKVRQGSKMEWRVDVEEKIFKATGGKLPSNLKPGTDLDGKPIKVTVAPVKVEGRPFKYSVTLQPAKSVKGVPAPEAMIFVRQDSKELERLESELKQLKESYNAKTYSQLDPEQQVKLKELMGSRKYLKLDR
ncbi:MAG: hypothetical protein ACAH95_06340 [Fimbriimonas sp.]